MSTSLSSKLSLEFTSYQLDHLKHILRDQISATQAEIDYSEAVDHQLTNRLLLEISLLERLNEASPSAF